VTPSPAAPSREKAGGRVVLVVLVVVLLLVGAGYAAAYATARGTIARGTTVAGVDVGGRTPERAAEVLRAGLAERVREPVTVRVEGESRTWSLTPARLGLRLDPVASVAQAGGHDSLRPSWLWDQYTGGDALDAVVDVDDAALGRALDTIAADVERAPRDGSVRFAGDRIVTTDPREGLALDRDRAAGAVMDAFLTPGAEAELVLEPVTPAIDAGDVRRAVDRFANPAVSAPVTLGFGRTRVRLAPREYAPALVLRARDGRVVPALDEWLLDRLLARSDGATGAPTDARVVLVAGRPEVVPARPGVTYDRRDVRTAFLRLVARRDGARELAVRSRVAGPEVTTREARAWRIREKVSSFTTYFPYAEYRNTNIGRAAELVDGTVLAPGETFSLNDTVGERTRENGFTEGFIISDGIFKEDLGGGVSQMATTTFNAMFFAGLEDVEHKPHSFYIDRYPVGREATVAWGAVDLRFRNDTPYGVLIDAHLTRSTPSSQGVLTVGMWSTKVWDVTATTSERYDQTQPQTRVLRTADCYPNEGYAGFDVDVTRHFHRPGRSRPTRSEVFHTTYTPSDTVICRPPAR
jgi:vancomycin resistance protein YoaR